jgi:hypothetical protein
MNQTARFQAVGQTPTYVAPIITPAMAQDIGGGNITSTSADPGRGLSPFRIVPENYSTANSQMNQNRVYTASLMGTGPVGDQALEMVLDTTKFTIPTTTEEFRGSMESYYVALLIYCGPHNRAVQTFYTNVVSQLNTLIALLTARYLPEQHPGILLKIQVYVHLMMNDYLSQLIAAAVPTAINVAVGAPVMPPDFRRIQERFSEGTIQEITSIPPALVSQATPRNPIPRGGEPPPTRGPPTRGGGGTSGSGNAQVRRPNQNPRVRAAWSASGNQAIFTEGAPFHDPEARNGKKVVMSDDGVTPVCIPMICRGICFEGCRGKHDECSRAEEDRVVVAGGLTL